MKEMKAIIFGLGSIGSRHAEILDKYYPEIELYIYHHKDSMFTKKFIDDKFDMAFICNPTNLHVATALQCLKKGIKNIFIEKPLSANLDGLSLLKDYSEKHKDINIYIGHNLRYDETLLTLKKILDNNKECKESIFYIDVIHSSYLPNWREVDYKECYSASKGMGGGVILDMSHEFDYIQWIFGEMDILNTAQISAGKISNLEITSEDYCDLLFGITDKRITGRIHLDYFGLNTKRSIDIYYKDGQISVDLIVGKIEMVYDKGNTHKRFMNYSIPNHSYRKQMEHFIESIKNKKNISNLTENINLMEKLMKIKHYME